MNNNTILAIAFLLAGTLLTAATTAMAPAYAGGDGNKQKVEDNSAGALNDCDTIKNEIEDNTFENINECIAIAATDESIIRDREPTPPEPEPEPETCEECFERFLGPDEIADLVAVLDEANQAESLVEFCEGVLEPGFITEGEVRDFLTSAEVDEEIQDDLIECLEAVGIVFEPEM
jgi:hypothetical protein